MKPFPDISYYLEDWSDETVPCDTTLAGWAEWLSKPDHDWSRPEPARDGDTFAAWVVEWQEDIVATCRAGGEWTFSRPIPADAAILAVRFGEGLGWDCDMMADDEDGLREVLGSDGEIGDTELIAVGANRPQVTVVYRINPLRLEVVAKGEAVDANDPFAREARQIAEVMAEDGGCWIACSGCQDSVDGCVSATDYPYDARFKCQPGAGCRECGGIGVTWQDGAFLSSWGDALAEEPAYHPTEAVKPLVAAATEARNTLHGVRMGHRADLSATIDRLDAALLALQS